jgi:hypothetical protein
MKLNFFFFNNISHVTMRVKPTSSLRVFSSLLHLLQIILAISRAQTRKCVGTVSATLQSTDVDTLLADVRSGEWVV